MPGTHGPSIRKAKLRPPVVAADMVTRARLTESLRDGLAGPLTVVCAPAGYGKTSLVSAHLRTHDGPVAWVTLDAGDASPERIARLVAAAVRRAFPDAFADLDTHLASHEDPRALASWLADEMDELDTDLVLALDELECVSDAGVHALLASLVEYPPEPLHLVVTTRHDPPWPLASLRARGSLREIRQAELAFRADEVRRFVQAAAGLLLDDDAVVRIHERTEGWPAAVRMIALALSDASAPDDFLARLPRGVARVEEFLAEAVLARQPADVRSLLPRTALVDRLDAGLVDALRGDDAGSLDGPAVLELVRRRNLFVSEDDGQSIRLHTLFREFLVHTLRRTATDEQIRALHDRVRDHLDALGEVEDAIEHALRGTRPESAIDVLARHRVAFLNAERHAELAGWVARIRAEAGTDALVLRFLDASIALPVSQLAPALDAIEGELPSSGLPEEECAEIRGEIHALRALERGAACAFEEASRHAAAALQELPATATAARGSAWFARAINAQASGDVAGAHAAAAAYLEETAHSGGAERVAALAVGPVLHWREGELMRVTTSAERVLAQVTLSEAPTTFVTLRVIAGHAHYLRNELADAERSLRSPGGGAFPSGELALARTLHAAGRCAEADEIVARVLRSASGGHGVHGVRAAHAARAELAFRRGDVASALEWAESVTDDRGAEHSQQRSSEVVLAAALVAAGDGARLARAEAVLDRVVEGARRRRSVPTLSEALAVRAAAAAARNDVSAAVAALADALELTARGGSVRTYLDLAPGVLPFLHDPSIPESLRTHARAIAAAAGGPSAPPPSSARRVLAEDLTNREEDVLELLADRLTNKEIAQRLHVAPETVKRHLGNVYGKLHVGGRREAVAKARALGLLPPR